MQLLTQANIYYGQLRGYQRASIASRVKATLACTPDEIRRQQLIAFRAQVLHCLARFPLYATKVHEHVGGTLSLDDEFSPHDLPLWNKSDQRTLFASLDPADFQDCFRHASGGSTGVPTQFYMTRHSFEWRTAVARRGYALASADPGRRTFFVWGDSATKPAWHTRFKSRLNQFVENRTYFNCFFFDDSRKQLCCQAINNHRPVALVGYAGKFVELAAYCREHASALRWRAPNIVIAAEGLQPGQRELLEEHLGERVFMSYGSREFMLIGMESREQVGYHLSDDNLYVEVVDDAGRPVPAGQPGQIAVTDLHNAANPFVRYLIGDVGVMADDDDRTENSRLPFRRLLEVQGRHQEFVYTPDGDKLTMLYFAHNLKEFAWIEAFQIVQRNPAHLVIRIRSRQLLTTHMKQQLEQQLRPKLGTARIDVEQVGELTRRANGKLALLITEMPAGALGNVPVEVG